MKKPIPQTRFERFQLHLLRKKPIVQGLIFGGAFLILSSLIYAAVFFPFMAEYGNKLLFIGILFLVSILIPSVIMGIVFPASLKLNVDRLTRILGFIPTPEEQVALRAWFVRGVTPESERLRHSLKAYLTFVEPYAKGKKLYPYRWLSIVLFVVFVLNVIQYGFKIFVARDFNGFDVYFFVFSVLFSFAVLPVRFKNGNPLLRLLNTRTHARYVQRSRELESKNA